MVIRFRFLVAALAVVYVMFISPAAASDIESLLGTRYVQFAPIQSGGELKGCSLLYQAVARDYVQRDGDLIIATGNISYFVKNTSLN